MAFFFGIYLLLCLSSIRFRREEWKLDAYMSREHTQAVKGIFILMVYFSHFGSYVTYVSRWDLLCRQVIFWFGQAMVAMFLFYSGFGVMESIRIKGRGYVRTIPRNRVLSTLFRFDCAVLLYALVALTVRRKLSVGQFFQALIGWKSIGNSNWYIFDILILYLITYVAFSLIRQEKIALMAVFGGCCLLILLLWKAGGKAIHWYDTVLCYWLGMVFSVFKKRFEKCLNKNAGIWLILIIGLFEICHALSGVFYVPQLAIVRNLCFAGFVTVLTMRVNISSRVLSWCRQNLFPLYILQRIPMILLKYLGLSEWSIPLYFLACLLLTVALAFPFTWATDRLIALLSKKSLSKIDSVK